MTKRAAITWRGLRKLLSMAEAKKRTRERQALAAYSSRLPTKQWADHSMLPPESSLNQRQRAQEINTETPRGKCANRTGHRAAGSMRREEERKMADADYCELTFTSANNYIHASHHEHKPDPPGVKGSEDDLRIMEH